MGSIKISELVVVHNSLSVSWELWALTGIIFWSLVNVLDNYFVEDSYPDEYAGLVVSALFNFFPALFVWLFFVPDFSEIYWPTTTIGIPFLAGVFLMLAYFCYFRCLFCLNDNVALQIVWILSSPIILFLGYCFLGDDLNLPQYCGAGLILAGVFFLNLRQFNFRKGIGQYLFWGIVMNVFYSLNEILMKGAYEVQKVPFWTVFFLFLLGQLSVGIIAFIFRVKIFLAQKRTYFSMFRRFWLIFVIAEILEQLASFFTQRALDTTPYVSFYGALEAGMPVYVLFTGLIFSIILRLPFFNKTEIGRIIWKNFKTGLKRKMLATVLVVVGIFLLT